MELLPEEGAADWRDIKTITWQEPVWVCKFCQGRNNKGRRNGVIDKSTLWNGVVYYDGEEYYLAIVEAPKEDSSRG